MAFTAFRVFADVVRSNTGPSGRMQPDRDSRAAKLHQAWQLTKEALRISPRH
jgi:hypothetical protein